MNFLLISAATVLLNQPGGQSVAQPVQQGKVEVLQEIVRSSCAKSLDTGEALKLVKKVYLTCVSGDEIEVDSQLGRSIEGSLLQKKQNEDRACKIKCLRVNAGTVIGG
jgi:hypothetical protein